VARGWRKTGAWDDSERRLAVLSGVMEPKMDVSVDLSDHADVYEFVRNTVNVFSTQVRAEMSGTITVEARETEKLLVRVRDEYKALCGRVD
jgi:hypothetical protein